MTRGPIGRFGPRRAESETGPTEAPPTGRFLEKAELMKSPGRTGLVVAIVSAVTFLAVAPASSDQPDVIDDVNGSTDCPLNSTGAVGYEFAMPNTVVKAGESYEYTLPQPVSGDADAVSSTGYVVGIRVYDGYDGREFDPAAIESVALQFLYADGSIAGSTVGSQEPVAGSGGQHLRVVEGVLQRFGERHAGAGEPHRGFW